MTLQIPRKNTQPLFWLGKTTLLAQSNNLNLSQQKRKEKRRKQKKEESMGNMETKNKNLCFCIFALAVLRQAIYQRLLRLGHHD